MRKILTLSSLVFFLALSLSVSAQKIGYVDSQAIIEMIPEVKEAKANIETFRTQLQKRGQEMLQALQRKYQDLERREAQGEIAPKQLEAEVAKLKEEEGKIMQFEQESQQKIVKKSEELLSPIRDNIQQAISEVASENGYDYIFDFSTGFVLYADQSTNVNELVKAKMGL
jgi:outer membrane protein